MVFFFVITHHSWAIQFVLDITHIYLTGPKLFIIVISGSPYALLSLNFYLCSRYMYWTWNYHLLDSLVSLFSLYLFLLFVRLPRSERCLWFVLLQSLVPLGSVEELLAAYDSQRRELPPPVVVWQWGWTKSAETWNGRAAMLAVFVLLVLEVTTGEGFLHQWGILPLFRWLQFHLFLFIL